MHNRAGFRRIRGAVGRDGGTERLERLHVVAGALELVHEPETGRVDIDGIEPCDEIVAVRARAGHRPLFEGSRRRRDDRTQRSGQPRRRDLRRRRVECEQCGEHCRYPEQRDRACRRPSARRVGVPGDDRRCRPHDRENKECGEPPSPQHEVEPDEPEDAADREQRDHERGGQDDVEPQQCAVTKPPRYEHAPYPHDQETEPGQRGPPRRLGLAGEELAVRELLGHQSPRVQVDEEDVDAITQPEWRLGRVPEVVVQDRKVAGRGRELVDHRRYPHEYGDPGADERPTCEPAELDAIPAPPVRAEGGVRDHADAERDARPEVRNVRLGTERAGERHDGQHGEVVTGNRPDRQDEHEEPEHGHVRVPRLREDRRPVRTGEHREDGSNREHEPESASAIAIHSAAPIANTFRATAAASIAHEAAPNSW